MIAAPIFVVGHPRSGTTMLATTISKHSGVSIPPETQFLIQYGTEGEIFSDAEFADMLRTGRLADLELDVGVATARFAKSEKTRRAAFECILMAYQLKSGCQRVGEKSPLHLWHSSALLDWFPDAKLVCIERNGIAVIASLLEMPWSHQNIIRHAFDWRHSVFEARKYQRRHPQSFMRVAYEDVVKSPRQAVADICKFLDLAFEEQMLAPCETETIPSWERKWKSGAAGAISVVQGTNRKPLAWHRKLLFYGIAADAMLAGGYVRSKAFLLLQAMIWLVVWPYHPKARPFFQRLRGNLRVKK